MLQCSPRSITRSYKCYTICRVFFFSPEEKYLCLSYKRVIHIVSKTDSINKNLNRLHD